VFRLWFIRRGTRRFAVPGCSLKLPTPEGTMEWSPDPFYLVCMAEPLSWLIWYADEEERDRVMGLLCTLDGEGN
jgi:hypothetical protein